jgi:organic radical activating enzyme
MRRVKFYGIGFLDPQDFVVSWNLGNSCNWSCDYCPPFLNNGSVYWVENDIVKDTLLKIRNHFPDRKIRVEFTGGEVTTNPNFIDLMQFCSEQGFNSMIITNASRTENYWEKLAPHLQTVIATFHPLNADKTHFEKIIDIMLKHECRPNVSLAMVKDVFDDMVNYKQYLKDKYQDKVYVDFILLYDKMKQKPYKGYFYDYNKDQIDILSHSIGKHFITEFEDGSIRHLSTAEIWDEKLNDFTGYLCGSKLNMISIDFNGGASISVCDQRQPINIRTDNFDEMLTPKICTSEQCRNPSDLRILKVRQK